MEIPYPFESEKELRDIPNILAITRQVGETHFGLGARAAFLMVCNVGNMGVLQVGNVGVGKTRCLQTIAKVPFRHVFTKKFTMAGVKQKFNRIFTNNRVTWISYEMADMSEIVVANMLKVVCDILTDHECVHSTSHYDCDITNSIISWLGACTYDIYNNLWQIIQWRGNFRDRILTYFAFRLKLKKINVKIPRFTITYNMPLPEEISCENVDSALFKEIVKMLEAQFSPERATEYTWRLLQGSAALNHRRSATNADAKFILLNKTNMEAMGWVASRKTVSGPLKISADALMIFSEALKRNGVNIYDFKKAPYYLENVESVIDALQKYPHLFKRYGDLVFPNPGLVVDKITPKIKFESFCIEHGTNFYRGV